VKVYVLVTVVTEAPTAVVGFVAALYVVITDVMFVRVVVSV